MKHILDIIFFVILLFAAWRGYKNGFIKSFATLAALALGIWGAAKVSVLMSDWIQAHLDKPSAYVPIISFVFIFVLIICFVLLFARMLSSMINDGAIGVANRLAGILINIIKYALSLSIIVVIIDRFNNRLNFMDPMLMHDSVLWSPFLSLARWLYVSLPL